MATRRIKESYGPPVIPKDATPQQRQQILQEHRKHQDLVKQLNDVRTAQDDSLEALSARIAALESEPTLFAFGIGTTNGAGGITTTFTFGGTLAIVGSTIRLNFTTPRLSVDNYAAGGSLFQNLPGRWSTTPTRSTTFCDTRFYTSSGVVFDASVSIFTACVWAMGLRA